MLFRSGASASVQLVVRSGLPAADLARAITARLLEVDPRAAIQIRSIDVYLRSQTVTERMTAVLSLFFGALALLLAAIGLYGLGMALLVSGLTVTLALANTAVLRVLRKGMQWFEYVAGVFVLLTGLYLTWYWYTDLRDTSSGVVNGAVSWQERVSNLIQRNQSLVVTIAVVAVVTAVGWSVALRRRHE